MNIAIRKLAMLEQAMIQQEEAARIQGYTTDVINSDFKRRITDLMDRVRVI